MNIVLAPDDEKFIKNEVMFGRYVNISEVVRDAIRHLRDYKQDRDTPEARHKRLLAALAAGEADIKAGRVTVYDKNFMKKNMAEVRKLAAAGGPFDPDVVGPEDQEPWI